MRFGAVGNRLVVRAEDWEGQSRLWLWSTDGTAAGTNELSDPAPIDTYAYPFTPAAP